MTILRANHINIFQRETYFAELIVDNGKIISLKRIGPEKEGSPYMLPGFIDAHVHIESSMLTPSQFARMAVVHGTVGTVSDPHEIANVLGIEGVKYMIDDSKKVAFHFAFGAPSCVPATSFETAGANIGPDGITEMMAWDDIYYLAEMMNYPGVIYGDPEVMAKIQAAKKSGKPIDGHAPGLMGQDMSTYFKAGISTDHECYLLEEAEAKLIAGVKVLIREGSAAKNFETLIPLAKTHAKNMMFCSDDKHPDDLVLGHINQLVWRAINDHQLDMYDVLYMACVHPVVHYSMPVGLLREGDSADFVVFENKSEWSKPDTYIAGKLVASKGESFIPYQQPSIKNHFVSSPVAALDLKFAVKPSEVILAYDGQLITGRMPLPAFEGETSVEYDVLKIVVVNRYRSSPPACALIKGFGLKEGAMASSIAHDSHNIVAVGVDDEALVKAIRLVMENEGGISACTDSDSVSLPLPIAGLISDLDGYEVAERYQKVHQYAKQVLGSGLTSPFMSLSFMALLVIPELKLSDLGLFDGGKFEFVKTGLG